MDNRREGTRRRKATKFFTFGKSHGLFSENTRRCEEKIKKTKQNVQAQRKFYNKQRNEKIEEDLKRLKASNKELNKKISVLEKKIAKKN